MSPERKTLFGIAWKNDNLGVTTEHLYGMNYHFVKDGEEERIQLDWLNIYLNGMKGWKVGTTSAVTHYGVNEIPIGADRDIILFDGQTICTDLDKKWIKKI